MKKSVLLIVSMWLLSGQIFAQRFEWAKGFAPGENVAVVGSVTDSVGNLYILGSINFNTCWENGSRLLPITPYGHARNMGDILIAKISPEGDLVWHKVIHAEGHGRIPHDIKPVGDTAFACLVHMPLASESGYLYYLDTLVRKGGDGIYPDYPMSGLYIATGSSAVTALITFDFDGNVLEQHFLWMSYLDYNGEDIVRTYTQYPQPWYQARTLDYPSFAIDNEGNIYLSRWTNDMISAGQGNNYSVENGTISAVKFWCDCRVAGIAPADSNLFFSPQILKFSPHFDTLLNARYVFQNNVSTSFNSHHLWCDNSNKLYYLYNTDNDFQNNTIVIDSTQNLSVSYSDAVCENGFLVIYNQSLAPEYLINIEDSVIHPDIHYSFLELHDLAFDYDSNLVFLSASTARGALNDTTSFFSILTFRGHPLFGLKNNSFYFSFKLLEDTILFHSYGVTPSMADSDGSRVDAFVPHGNLACKNNRVFMQSWNYGGLRLPNRTLEWGWYQGNLGFIIFDYQGNVLDGTDYGTILQGSRNTVGPISLRDSTLYLINRLITGATFGDIQVPSRGTYFACIAKYVDPAFMYPYGSAPTGISSVDTPSISVYPNPATDKVHVSLPTNELVIEAYVIDLAGRRRQVPAIMHNIDLTSAPAGILLLQIVTNNHIYTQRIIKL